MNLQKIYLSTLVMIFMITNGYTQVFERNSLEQDSRFSSDVLIFDINTQELNKKLSQRSQVTTLNLPFLYGETLELQLEEIALHTPNFKVYAKTATGKIEMPYTSGKYYRGTIDNNNDSHVTLSVHGDQVSGVIWDGSDTYDFGKMLDSDKHILYRSESVKEDLALKCSTNTQDIKPSKQTFSKSSTSCNVVVEVYFECDYQMYQNLSSNETTVTNYVNSMFAEVQTLYNNESISTQISEIMVWTVPDSYSSGTAALAGFANSNPTFNGDLAHLLTNDTGSNGGVAYVDQLCGNNPYAYSDILNSSQVFPTYSWDVQVVSHELGHNFGSSHTHDCTWGPNNNQQIDDCGNVAFGGGSCYDPNNAIIPSSGGTIMSYCHLNNVGINFNNGFGAEPGDLIRDNHSDCMCDNATCEEATIITATGTFSAQPSSGGGASASNAVHADWYEFTPNQNGIIDVRSCNGGVDTRVWVHSGTCASLTVEDSSDDDCISTGSLNYASEVVGLNVTAGTTYFIEWDNRWSSGLFDWDFTFVLSSGGMPVNISCPSDYIGNNTCSSIDYDPSVTGTATSSVSGAVITHTDNFTSTTCDVDIVRTWTVTDSNGDTAECDQLIELNDIIPPVVTFCPPAISVVTNTSANCEAHPTWAQPSATDDCGMVNVSLSHVSGSLFPIGTTVVTATFQDGCGNSAACNFVITVIDGCSNMMTYNCNDYDITLNGTITDPMHIAENNMDASGIFADSLDVLLRAGGEIEFGPGFEIKAGSTLEAMIGACEN